MSTATSDSMLYLPGLDSVEHPVPTASAFPIPGHEGLAYWIRTSKEQTLDKNGHPAGFRHQLMRGKKIVRFHSGMGADVLRTLRAQAAYFNSILAASTGGRSLFR